jgi:hypothetical protein
VGGCRRCLFSRGISHGSHTQCGQDLFPPHHRSAHLRSTRTISPLHKFAHSHNLPQPIRQLMHAIEWLLMAVEAHVQVCVSLRNCTVRRCHGSDRRLQLTTRPATPHLDCAKGHSFVCALERTPVEGAECAKCLRVAQRLIRHPATRRLPSNVHGAIHPSLDSPVSFCLTGVWPLVIRQLGSLVTLFHHRRIGTAVRPLYQHEQALRTNVFSGIQQSVSSRETR